jgi:hypothetical protein
MAEASDSRGHPHRSPPLRTGLLTAIVTVVALTSAGCSSSSDDDDADQADPPAVSADPAEVADPAIAVVVSAFDVKNRFDLDGWLMSFEGGERQGTPLYAEEILMNANQHWEVVEPCQVTGETASGDTIVECLISNTDDFWGAGGIFDTRAFEFHVNADGLITKEVGLTPGTRGFSSERRDTLNRAFSQWLSDTYPDVFAETGFLISSNGPGFDARDSTHMLVAVEYVEEFVAQSDDYPLDATEL